MDVIKCCEWGIWLESLNNRVRSEMRQFYDLSLKLSVDFQFKSFHNNYLLRIIRNTPFQNPISSKPRYWLKTWPFWLNFGNTKLFKNMSLNCKICLFANKLRALPNFLLSKRELSHFICNTWKTTENKFLHTFVSVSLTILNYSHVRMFKVLVLIPR